jgi:predicted nucleotidyltransferase
MQIELNKERAVEILDGRIETSRVVMYGYRGSIAHGTFIPSTDPNSIDDIDVMGVYLAPIEYYVGLGGGRRYQKGWDFWVGEYDCVFYEFRKFISLLLNSNPNVLSMLWMRPEHHIIRNAWTDAIVDNRHAFMSKRMETTFIGYASGQLKRMTHFATEGYMGDKRKQLVEKYGYDVKNAAHVIRLLIMGAEALRTGEIEVYRKDDADFIKTIKTGGWTLDQIKAKAEELFADARTAGRKSTLPEHPDFAKVEEICKYILVPYITSEYSAQLLGDLATTKV